MVVTASATLAWGNLAPMAKARPLLTKPAVRPFHIAICDGSLPEILRVRLLSIPQQRQAAAMRSVPPEMAIPSFRGSESRIPPRTIRTKPVPTRLSTFSRKINHAIAAVATASRLSKRDAVLAWVVDNPNRRRVGPATPPARVAPASHGRSARERGVSVRLARDSARTIRKTARPIPDPR